MKWLKDKKGFEFIEVVIVVAVIGLLSAIAIPNFIRVREIGEAEKRGITIEEYREIQAKETETIKNRKMKEKFQEKTEENRISNFNKMLN